MGFQRHYQDRLNFIFTAPNDYVDDYDLILHFITSELKSEFLNNATELVYLKNDGFSVNVTLSGLERTARYKCEIGMVHSKVAILITPSINPYDFLIHSKIINSINKNLQLFYKIDEAINWLDFDECSAEDLKIFMENILSSN